MIHDLRSTLRYLGLVGDPPLVVRSNISHYHEIAAAYAWYGGGTPVAGPTQGEHAVLFDNVGPGSAQVLLGMFSSRKRCASLLGCEEAYIGHRLLDAVINPIAPVEANEVPCQEEVERTPDLQQLPIMTTAPGDAGPYITMGVVMASNQDGRLGNISVHRLCVKSANELTIWMVPGRDLERLYLTAKAEGRRLPVSINIGLDPAIYIASACTGPLTPPGFDELSVAGAMRERAVEVSSCSTVAAQCIANAEYVIEGEIGHEVLPESDRGGKSLPEFLGYDGGAHPGLPVVYVTAITHRRNPIFQAVIGPGLEQSHLLAFGMEAAALDFLSRYVSDRFKNVRAHPGGGGQLLLFVQMQKENEQDDAVARRAGTALMAAFRMVKQIVLVDEDVNIFNDADVWWAMATRLQAGQDIITVDNIQGFPLDPSQTPEFHKGISSVGATGKVCFDCTVPFRLRERFQRSEFGSVPDEVKEELMQAKAETSPKH